MERINYRPEIDGFRAIAVISVLIYHLNIVVFNHQLLSGGYLGVDIFFVISGYLITSLILKNLLKDSFSFIEFYERRARRILPALLIVIIFCLVVVYFYFLPDNLKSFVRQVNSIVFLFSNYQYWFDSNIYNATTSVPLLISWSLSVEEQFYVFFPLFLFLVLFYGKEKLKITLIVLFILSLLSAILLNKYFPYFNFYNTISRAFELLAGSYLAYSEIYFKNQQKGSSNIEKKSNANLFFLIGIVLIVIPLFFFENEFLHPSLLTLIPVFGTVLIIKYSAQSNLKSLFSGKIIVFIGLISYSIYLWHYPLIYFNEFLDLKISKINLIFLTFVISTLSYFIIEKPFRNRKILKKVKFYSLLSLLFLIIFSLNFFYYKNNYFLNDQKHTNFVLKNLYGEEHKSLMRYESGFYLREIESFFKKIDSFDKNEKNYDKNHFTNSNKKKYLIIGNSFGRDLFKTLYLTYPQHEISYQNLSIACIKYFSEKNSFKEIYKKYRVAKCFKKKMNRTENLIIKSDYIILSSRYSTEDLENLEIIIKNLLKFKKKIFITSHGPLFEMTEIRRDFSLTRIDKFFYKNNRMPNPTELIELEKEYYSYNFKKTKNINSKIQNIASSMNVSYLNRGNLICDDDKLRCSVINENNEKLFFDYGHFTLPGMIYIGNKIKDFKWFN